jgi:ABC-type lipoprotein export system ATPase subunit
MKLVDEEEGTLLYVTHSQEQAAQADERLRLHGGKLEPA